MESIGGNIISSLGAGSGLNSTSIVQQLSDVEKAPRQAQIDSKKTTIEAQISDYGVIRSALSTLQDAAKNLSDSETFNSKSASFGQSDAFIPESLDENVPVGNYSFEVIDVAQSQSISTAVAYADPTDAIGKGTLTFDFGSWDAAEPPTTFTQNSDKDSVVITIDDSNNSLNGLRDAINAAEAGVVATVVNDGSGYQLLLTAESGQSNQLQVTAAEEVGAEGLASFDFNQSSMTMNQAQSGKDAILKVNGLEVTRSTNSIDDVIEGFNFTLAKADPGNIVNVSISEDKAGGEQAVRDFVETFNAFLEAIEPAVGFDSEEQEDGSLKRDPAASSIQSQLRTLIASSLGGIEEGFTSLTNVGIRTELDGTLTINENDFSKAFDENYDLVKTLFVPQATSTSDKIQVNSAREEAVPGTYAVNITQDAETGGLIGADASATLLADLAQNSTAGGYIGAASAFAATDFQTQGAVTGDYGFDISVDGGDAVSIVLPIADYADENEIAAALQLQFDISELNATITHDGTSFVIDSSSSGTSSSIAISNVLENTPGEFGLAAGSPVSGTGPNEDDFSFTVNVDGTESGLITIPLGTYASQEELAAIIQSQINNDEAIQATGGSVDVEWKGSRFEFDSRAFGSKSSVSVTAVGGQAVSLGLDSGASFSGKDVAGTFDGVAGFGLGKLLLPELDSDPYGISLVVQPGATSGDVNFSRGFGSELSQLIDTYLESNGLISQRETTLEKGLEDLEDDQDKLDARSSAHYDRLLSQFLAMERIISSLNGSRSTLDDIGNRLPFTAQSG